MQARVKVAKEPVTVLGFVEEEKNGRLVATKKPKSYRLGFEQDFVPTESVKRPAAYLIPAKYKAAIENLTRHGLRVEELSERKALDVEVYTVSAIDKATRPFEGHTTTDLKVTAKVESRTFDAGTAKFSTSGPLGTLAVYLLEPRSDDGLTTWNFFDDGLVVGRDFPVYRLPVR
jgi:hypothetical protein